MMLVLLIAIAAAQQANFGCLQVCRVPYFTCIQKGIPGHEIQKLQQCVIDDRAKGIYDEKYPDCVKCIDNVRPETDFPTAAVTNPPTFAPVTQEFCDQFSKRPKVCLLEANTGGSCHWEDETKKCIPGSLPLVDGHVPPLDTLQPCLKICQEYALECNFSVGINQKNVTGMRGCAYELAEDQLRKGEGDARTIQECKGCLEDIFDVVGNPLAPPEDGFTIFNDYRRWMEKQITEVRCKQAGGKFKQKHASKPGKCVINKAKKLRCKKVKRMDICRAVGCNVKKPGTENEKCNGKNKWK